MIPAGAFGTYFSEDEERMTLENKLGIQDDIELAHEEEKLSKMRALELFESGMSDEFEIGTFAGLAQVHAQLFQDVYDFAGQMRTVDIAKGGFQLRLRALSR